MSDETGRPTHDTSAEQAQENPAAGEDLMEDLIDEVSIDGMCGVY